MGRVFIVVLLGAALFFGGAWYLGLFESMMNNNAAINPPASVAAVPEEKLGDDLFKAADNPPFVIPERSNVDPIVLNGVMNLIEQEEVPGPTEKGGRILFIGTPVEENAVLAAGSTPFLTEPYYFQTIYTGEDRSFVTFYRRLYEGNTVQQDQILAMIEPAKALGAIFEKKAKVEYAQAEYETAVAGAREGKERLDRAQILYNKGALPKEELGSAILTYEKLLGEKKTKFVAIKIADQDKRNAEIELYQLGIRALLPYKTYTIKSIARQAGYYVKQQEPTVMTVQSLDRLQAEALVEEQYYSRLKQRKNITATIEPTILEDPLYELPGHAKDVTSVAVSQDMKIVSGSEDKTVCVWSSRALAPVRKFDVDDAVTVVACTPVGADKNLCLAGCANGSIYLWNLADGDHKPIKPIEKANGNDVSITSLAVSPDGKFFASGGGSDGSIRLWSIGSTDNDGQEVEVKEKFAFVPENGVAQHDGHGDAVTALHFTPQCRLVSAGHDNTLRVWKLKEKGAVLDGKPINYREGIVTRPGVSQDGKWMLFDQGRTLKWLSVQNHQLVHALSVPVSAKPFETFALFSPDSSLILTAGAPEGRLQLWHAPDAKSRGFEVRQFATRERQPVTAAAFSPEAGKGGANSFAVSASGHKIFVWSIPTPDEVNEHRITGVPITLINQNLEFGTQQSRVGFRVVNQIDERHPNGRFEAGRPVTIVID